MLTAAQIVTLACQTAKCPGYIQQAGQLLNYILSELCTDYDFALARKSINFNFSTSASGNGYAPGSGPNNMNADFLRVLRNGSFYQIQQVPYQLIGMEQDEFDLFVQQPGLNSYPYAYYVDTSLSPPGLFVWPPASGAFAATVRYGSLMPEITTPETSNVVPWFPNQNYLLTRLSGELMKLTNDTRCSQFLGDGQDDSGIAIGARAILNAYLKMKDNPETAVKRVGLDRRRFGSSTDRLKNTKKIGW